MHDGHRYRMRERILQSGIEGLQPHEVLEYLLYSFIPRKDTNELAHTLIQKYGSLSRVLTANYADLASENGMTQNAALFLSNLPAVFKLYVADLSQKKTKVYTRGDVLNLLKPKFLGDNKESFYLMCLDAQNNVLKLEKLNEGTPSEVAISARIVVEHALQYKATSVILAHNHPSGNVTPSNEDIELTRSIAVALKLVKIRLIDHFIIGGEKYYSFAEDGLVDVIGNDINRIFKEGLKY